MALTVALVQSPEQAAAFNELARLVYARDPFHVPCSGAGAACGALWVAFDGGSPVARCRAQLQTGNPARGTIGAFEALNVPAAARVLLETAVRWLRERGAQEVVGPMDGDTWHAYRLNTGPFGEPPFVKEPWNPPYYAELWQSAGFRVRETYDSFAVDDPGAAADNQKKYYARCLKNGYTFAPLRADTYRQALPVLYDLSCRIFSGNVLYTPLSAEAFNGVYGAVTPLLRTGLSWLAYLPDGAPAGYVFAYPDVADALRAMRGKTGLAAQLRFMLAKRRATRTCLKTLGVVPEARGSGLAAALSYLAFENSRRLGYRATLMCLMHSANDSRRLGGAADRPFRTYALYEYAP